MLCVLLFAWIQCRWLGWLAYLRDAPLSDTTAILYVVIHKSSRCIELRNPSQIESVSKTFRFREVMCNILSVITQQTVKFYSSRFIVYCFFHFISVRSQLLQFIHRFIHRCSCKVGINLRGADYLFRNSSELNKIMR